MTDVTDLSFEAFFEALWGYRPYAWQSRLASSVLSGTWPEQIDAPTGTGKSAVIDVHVFANAVSVRGGVRVARRLAVCVNRRAIVDQHEVRARQIADKLESATSGVLVEVRDALATLVSDGDIDHPLRVISMRGGAAINRDWIGDVSAVSVIAATPDMWASRVLFGGYGVSALARPREAGLLTMDCCLVVDEAHLSRQVVTTARDIAELSDEGARRINVPGLSVVATSATLGSSDTTCGVTSEDVAGDERLSRILTRPKPVTYIESDSWPANRRVTKAWITEIETLARTIGGQIDPGELPQTIGVFVNRVDTAIQVAHELARHVGEDAVVTWVGRMRECDADQLRRARPGLLSITGDASVQFLVATQTIEAGVDLDLAAMVSEIAPATSLVQRAGRINRRGLRTHAPVVIVGPSTDKVGDSFPYRREELDESLEWLGNTLDMAPSALGSVPQSVTRPVMTHVRASDAQMLSMTSPGYVRPELAFWIRDDLEASDDLVNIVMREGLPEDETGALDLLAHTPVVAPECFPTTLRTTREVLADLQRFFVVGEDGVVVPGTVRDIRPGATVIIDAAPLTWQGVITNADVNRVTPRCFYPVVSSLEGVDEPCVIMGVSTALTESVVDGVLETEMGRFEVVTRPTWSVFTPVVDVIADDETRQVVAPREGVELDTHQEAVGERVRDIATRLGFVDTVANACIVGALYHDEGKRDIRFQRETLANTGGAVLAKSGFTRVGQVSRVATGSLPYRWRHEQLSAAFVYASGYTDLSARLAGTSHGHGRPIFAHTSDVLLAGIEDDPFYTDELREGIVSLFENGSGWSDIIEVTDGMFSVWGCAYLEAVVRAADCMVSKEGS